MNTEPDRPDLEAWIYTNNENDQRLRLVENDKDWLTAYIESDTVMEIQP